MSTTIDQRVVEMRFDNKQFESNVSTTMSTLDKLKERLNLKGASKGLEDVSAAAKKVDVSSIGKDAETVGLRFNAMYTIADQAFRNITNAAMDAGKRIVSAFTIDPVKTGLSEYETKINAVQVIKANTRTKYDNETDQMNAITQALEELNLYADKTIYNFAQMTDNIGKFTAQGLGVQEAADAVKGLANLAAASGASAQDMARATYQISQAMSGTIRMIDWNSLRNANMATQDLKETLMTIARVNGVAIDNMIEKYGNFEQTLQDGWLTGEMFSEAMNIYSGIYSEAELKSKGFTESEIANFLDLAKQAESAATEVKTFTQLMDVLKETAQSGWTQTWEILIGDFTTAKKMWTNLQVYFGDIINAMSEARNFLLEGALTFSKPWSKIFDKLNKSGFVKIKETIEDATATVKNFQKVVNEVWRGQWKNIDTGRFELLEKAGYNPKVVQELVNLGSRHKITIEDVKAAHEKYGIALVETGESAESMTDALNNLTDKQLESAGLTESEIKLFRDLEKESKRTGRSIEELVDEMSNMDGRTMLIESFKNAWSGVLGIFKALKEAWVEIFPPMTVIQLYNIVKGVRDFSEHLRLTDKESGKLTATGDKLRRTFRGIFAALDIVLTLVSGPLRIAFKLVGQLLSAFGLTFFDVTAYAGDAIVKFRDWLDSVLDFSKVFEKIAPHIKNAVLAIRDWIESLKDSRIVKGFTTSIKEAYEAIRNWIVSLKDSENLPLDIAKGIVKGFGKMLTGIKKVLKNIVKVITNGFNSTPGDLIRGFVNGIWNGIKIVGKTMFELGKYILEKFREVLGIHSPSRQTMLDGKNFVLGFIIGIKDFMKSAWNQIKAFAKGCISALTGSFKKTNGIKGVFSSILSAVSNFVNKLKNIIKSIDFGQLLSIAMITGIFILAFQITSVLRALVNPLKGLGDMFEGLGDMFEGIGKWFRAAALKKMASAVLTFAIAIAILAMSIGYISEIDTAKVFIAIGAIAALGAVMVGLVALLSLAGKIGNGFTKEALGTLLFAGALFLLVLAIKKITDMDLGDSKEAMKTIASVILGMVGIVAILSLLSKGINSIDKAGVMMLRLSIALLIMVVVVKMVSKLSRGEINKGLIFVLGVGALFTAVVAVSKLAGKYAKQAGSMLLKMSLAMLIMVGVVKLASMLRESEIRKGISLIAKVELLFAGMIVLSRIAGKNSGKVISSLFGMALAMAMIIGVIAIADMLKEDTIERGFAVVSKIAIMFGALIAITKFAGNTKHLGSMLLKMSVAMLILVGVIFVLGNINSDDLTQGLTAVGILVGLMAGLIAVTKFAKSSKALNTTLILLMSAIVVLAGVVTGLSFLDPKRLAVAAGAMTAMIGVFALLVAATKFAKTSKNMTKTLFTMVGVIAAMAIILAMMSSLDTRSAIPNAIALGLLINVLSIAMKRLSSAKGMTVKDIAKASLAMAALTGILGMLGLVLVMMSALPVKNSIVNAIALSGLIIVLTGVAMVMSTIGKQYTNILKGALGLAALSGVMALIGLVLVMMSVLPVKSAMTNAMALSTLLIVLTGVAAVMAIFGAGYTNILQGALGMAALVGVMAMIGLVLVMMSVLPVKSAMTNAMTLSALMIVLTGIAAVMAIFGAGYMNILQGALGMAALVGVMALVGLVLVMMTALPVKNAITNATVLSELMIVLTGVAAVMAIFGAGWMNILTGALGMTALVAILALLALVLAMMEVLPMDNAEANAKLLMGMLTTMTEVCVVLAVVGPLALIGVTAMEALTKLMLAVGALAIVIGVLMTEFPALQEFLNVGIPVMEQLARGIGSIIGGFIAGLSAALVSTLPYIGEQLSKFIVNIGSFITGAKQIDDSVVDGIKNLAEVILILAGANFIDTLTSWITGGKALDGFPDQMKTLGEGLAAFKNSIGGFTKDDVELVGRAAEAVKCLAEAANEIPNSGGWVGKIVGENDLGVFADQFPALGTALKNFKANLGTFSDKEVETVSCAAEAIKHLAEAASEIPNSGGWVGAIVGENDLGTFADQFPELGTALKGFKNNIGTFNDKEVETVSCAAEAIKHLAEAASEIPNSGGWVGAIVGENDLGTFAESFPKIGAGFRDFLGAVNGKLTDDQMATLIAGAKVVGEFAIAADNIPETGGFWSKLAGGKDGIGSFAEDFPDVGTGIRGFIDAIGSFDTDLLDSGVYAVKTISSLGTVNTDGLSTNISTLKDNASGLGTAIKGFVTNAIGVTYDQVSAAVNNVRKIFGLIKDIGDTKAASANDFIVSLSRLGALGIDAFVDAFESNTAVAKVKDAANEVMETFMTAIDQNKSSLRTTFTSVVKTCVEAIESKTSYEEFKDAGKYLVDGFAAGISENTFKAEAKAAAMAEAAKAAAEAALKVNSPSKVFYEIGGFAGMGFVNALDDYGDVSYKAGSAMASAASDGLNNAIGSIADALDSDMDLQPTISPVLDLTNVRSGASALNGMLNTGASFGVVGSISAMMNQRGQNGGNDDVVSAINRLRKELGNVGNTSYNINGVTYDDGSSLAEAVQTIIRAAKIERRV